MRYFLTYLLLGLSISLSAQERIDTLYYDRSGRMAASPQLADYYRVALFPADSLHSGTFKDFYPTGELRRSGQFLSIDSLDDSNSRFDREVVSFFRNGRVAEQTCYTEGRREGACRQYDDEGHLRIESFYLGGRLTGLQHTYDGQGNCLLCVVNFSGIDQPNYRFGQHKGRYRLILDSDKKAFGGEGKFKKRILTTKKYASHGKEYSLTVDIPKLACMYFLKEK